MGSEQKPRHNPARHLVDRKRALALVGSPFPQVALIMAALSIAAGVLLIMGR